MSDPVLLFTPLTPPKQAPRLWTVRAPGFVQSDPWQRVSLGDPLPAEGHVLIPLERWCNERAAILGIAPPARCIGVELAVDDALDPIADDVAALELIVIPFPKFTDGRAYSTARRLREQWGYTGELRATGDILVDQLTHMLRSGFDALEVADVATLCHLERNGLPAPMTTYQTTGNATPFGFRSRSNPSASR